MGFIAGSFTLCFMIFVEWKSKLDECDKVIEELKKHNSGVTGNIAKLKRQINAKVTSQKVIVLDSKLPF